MSELLQKLAGNVKAEEPADIIALRLVLAVGFGGLVALARTLARSDSKPSPGLRTTLVLLTVLAALVTEVIGDNFARAFGLAGALAVVRFRTVVDDTRDSAFVIFAMVIGMAVGAGYLMTALIGLPIVAAVGVLARLVVRNGGPLAAPPAEAELEVRVKFGTGLEQELAAALAKFGTGVRLVETGTTKEGDGLELKYHLRPRPDADPTALVLDLKARPGVDKVSFSVK
jgi:uncharacterized membrane protein YhiD involved in acid resistance